MREKEKIYTVIWETEAEIELEKEVGDRKKSKKISDKVNFLLAHHPYSGKPLLYEWKGFWRIRFSHFRIIYKIIEEKIVVSVVKVDARETVYD